MSCRRDRSDHQRGLPGFTECTDQEQVAIAPDATAAHRLMRETRCLDRGSHSAAAWDRLWRDRAAVVFERPLKGVMQ